MRAGPAFLATLGRSRERLRAAVAAKLDDFFELAEYDWTPDAREGAPSMYLYELVNWLTTVLDALGVREADKDDAYRGAVEHVARSLVVSYASS
jgi:exocyst complex component 6